jgi:phosphoadenosine phosphosulfate reductase
MLEVKLDKSLEIIKEAFTKYEKVGLSWSTGKDSTLCLFLARKLNPDLPVIFTDTYRHFPETYQFRDKIAREWNLSLHIARAETNRTDELINNRERCCHYHKTVPFQRKIEELGLKAVIVGIRWDEHPSRSDEDYFSQRESHVRIHPILHWRWKEVVEFTVANNLPMNPLYSKKYTSIGCTPCTEPNPEKKVERAGRAKDKEEIMRRLRALGYF